jgi:Flp pilus assembly protein TadD
VDLTGAQLDINALEEAHWSGAKGMQPQAQSHAALHNAGVTAAESERWSDAEDLFGMAIRKQPSTPESWIARGISREKLGKRELAMQDLSYASQLFGEAGSVGIAKQLQQAATSLKEKEAKQVSGNGVGSAILNGLLNTSKALLPLAMKLLSPGVGL